MGMLFLRRCYPYMTSLDRHQLPSLSERQQERQAATFGGSSAPGHLAEGRLFYCTLRPTVAWIVASWKVFHYVFTKSQSILFILEQVPSNRSPGSGTCPLRSPSSLGLFLNTSVSRYLWATGYQTLSRETFSISWRFWPSSLGHWRRDNMQRPWRASPITKFQGPKSVTLRFFTH